MSGNTPLYALPYPTGTDRVADGDNAIQALAERVETVFTDTGWVAQTLYAASGWSQIAGYGPVAVRRIGKVCFMRGLLSKGAPTATGQRIIDPIPAAFRPASTERYAVLCYVTASAFMGTIQIDPNGVVVVDTATFSGNVLAMSLAVTWPAA